MTEDAYTALTEAVYYATLISVFIFVLCHSALGPTDRS